MTSTEFSDPSTDLIADLRTLFVTQEKDLPFELACGYALMNAARPLHGQKTADNGAFLAGRHYALIDLGDDLARWCVESNVALDGYLVIVLGKEELVRMALVDHPYFDQVLEEYPTIDDKWEVLENQIRDFQRKPYAWLMALQKKSLGIKLEGALV